MTEIAEKLKGELAQLSQQDRAELAYFLIHSLDTVVDGDAELAWEAELTRRVQEITSASASGEPFSQALTELREKYS